MKGPLRDMAGGNMEAFSVCAEFNERILCFLYRNSFGAPLFHNLYISFGVFLLGAKERWHVPLYLSVFVWGAGQGIELS